MKRQGQKSRANEGNLSCILNSVPTTRGVTDIDAIIKGAIGMMSICWTRRRYPQTPISR